MYHSDKSDNYAEKLRDFTKKVDNHMALGAVSLTTAGAVLGAAYGAYNPSEFVPFFEEMNQTLSATLKGAFIGAVVGASPWLIATAFGFGLVLFGAGPMVAFSEFGGTSGLIKYGCIMAAGIGISAATGYAVDRAYKSYNAIRKPS